MKLILDSWSEGKNSENVIEGPSLSTIVQAINDLDALSRTMLSLVHDESCFLMVAGPCHDGYLVNGTLNNRDFFSPKNVEAKPVQFSCFIGGQDGVYRLEQFVAKRIAEMAAIFFLKYHDFSPDIDWYSRNGRGPRLSRP